MKRFALALLLIACSDDPTAPIPATGVYDIDLAWARFGSQFQNRDIVMTLTYADADSIAGTAEGTGIVTGALIGGFKNVGEYVIHIRTPGTVNPPTLVIRTTITSGECEGHALYGTFPNSETWPFFRCTVTPR